MEKLTPFLPTLTAPQTQKADAWRPVLELLLNGRYGDRITATNEPVFIEAAADAISRRLARPNGMIDSQGVGSASVKYNQRALLARWFLPEQLSEMDVLAGLGSIRSVRTPAPDDVRFGNRVRYAEEEC